MIKIGCNWSAELLDLIRGGQVDVDYIKSWASEEFEKQIETLRALRPILLHGLGYSEYLGMASFDVIDFQRANRLIAQCGSPHYGAHLAMNRNDMPSNMSDEDIYNYFSERIQIFKKNICVPLLLENSPDFPPEVQALIIKNNDPYFIAYTEPEKVNKLLFDNDVYLLLDLTHAQITCLYKKWDIHDYLQSMPLRRVKEIHVNGLGHKEEFPYDPHRAMNDEDYELLDWVLGYCEPEIVTLEYNGIKSEPRETVAENLYRQLKKLNTICQSRG